MQTELKIKEILAGEGSAKRKADGIRKFMNWDKKEIMDAIARYGTSKEGRDSIIKKFWRKPKA